MQTKMYSDFFVQKKINKTKELDNITVIVWVKNRKKRENIRMNILEKYNMLCTTPLLKYTFVEGQPNETDFISSIMHTYCESY